MGNHVAGHFYVTSAALLLLDELLMRRYMDVYRTKIQLEYMNGNSSNQRQEIGTLYSLIVGSYGFRSIEYMEKLNADLFEQFGK